MFRNPRSSISKLLFLASVLVAAPASARDLDAVYPMAPSKAGSFAGVAIDRLTLPGLHVRTRDDHTADRGGITLSFANDHDDVSVVVRLCVAPDATEARTFMREILRGISGKLEPSMIDEVAFADASGQGDRAVVAARGNVAYAITVIDSNSNAAAVAEVVKRAVVAGAPAFPRASVTIPSSMDASGAPVDVKVSSGATYRLRASGAYVARAGHGFAVRPFGTGAVAVTAVVSDALGRVIETTATAVAR